MTRVPRLRIERIVIVGSTKPELKVIRSVDLHAGLNVVWARESAVHGGRSVTEASGHGVGKTTFCLMLRAVLGDRSSTVRTLCEHLSLHFLNGGVGAEVVAGQQAFVVFVPFDGKRVAHAYPCSSASRVTVEDLLAGTVDTVPFDDYVTAVGEAASLKYLSAPKLPVTGQAIEWPHILGWIARDQALGLRQFHRWRNSNESGLQREVEDPPMLVKSVLGVLSNAEADAAQALASVGKQLSSAKTTLRKEEQRGANIREMIEADLKFWAGVSDPLNLIGDDLFAASVASAVKRKVDSLEQQNAEARRLAQAIDDEVAALNVAIGPLERAVERRTLERDEATAQLEGKTQEAERLREALRALPIPSGNCATVGIPFSDCQHLQARQHAPSLDDKRKLSVVEGSAETWEERKGSAQSQLDAFSSQLAALIANRDAKRAEKDSLERAHAERLQLLGERNGILKSLQRWEESQATTETEPLRDARERVRQTVARRDLAVLARKAAAEAKSQRVNAVGARMAALAQPFGARGSFVPSDAERPFRLGANGEAFKILANLLGDLTCALEGANGEGAHPGLLIVDSPREADTGEPVYQRFLQLLHEVGEPNPGLQVVFTTTSPPPKPLREKPTCIMQLSHDTDNELLLCCRLDDLLSTDAYPAGGGR